MGVHRSTNWRVKWGTSVVGLLLLLAGSPSSDGALSAREAAALATAKNVSRPDAERVASIRRLGRAEYPEVSTELLKLISIGQPEPIRLAVVRTFTQIADPACVRPLLERWHEFSPAVQQAAFHAFTTRQVMAGEFLGHVEAGTFPLSELDTATRKRFENLGDKKLAARATELFRRQPVVTAKVRLSKFLGALKLKGNADRGREVFRERSCFNCHRLGGEGVFVGADLFTINNMPPREMLNNILSPNLFFMPNFQVFVAEDEEGELVEGLLAGSNSVTVTLRRALGDETILHRKSAKGLKGINVSLMPEGLLEGLSDQRVADLLEFIRTSKGDEGVGIANGGRK